MNSKVHIRFDFSECLTDYPQSLGTYVIDCWVPPYKVPACGEEVWFDDDDPCQVTSEDKVATVELLRYLHADAIPPFKVKQRAINFAKIIPYDILCVLSR